MLDLKSIQKAFAETCKSITKLESELSKQKELYGAYFRLIKAMGGDPNKAVGHADDVESHKFPQTLSLGIALTLPDVIKEAIPASGEPFGIDDIFPHVRRRFPSLKREELANALWRLSKHNQLKPVQKGKRGTPALYARP